jgi:Asp-tRNA(Asn)/Glu-tRNA(Gln) amidotransferase A subunit family amidase
MHAMSNQQKKKTGFDRRNFLKVTGGVAISTLLTGFPAARAATKLPLPEYEKFDAIGLAQLIRSKKITAREALEAAIARADIVNPRLNPINIRFDQLARDALDTLAPDAPLSGVPFLLKDLRISLNGTVTSEGCAFFRDAVADHDSTLTTRYREAGLVMFGKTTSPELGSTPTTESKLWGRTRNPWNPAYSSGGSSGGAAVAVASGIVPVAHASDGGGSIRIPASHCGLFGLKTSRGRIPSGPRSTENWMGVSVQHVISRSVRDSALLLQLTQGPEAGSRVSPPLVTGDLVQAIRTEPKGLRIALLDKNLLGAPIDPECLKGLQAAARLCETMGHHVEIAAPQLAIGEMFSGMGVVTGAGTLAHVREREKLLGRAAREDEFEPLTWRNLQRAKTYGADQLYQARASFDQAGRLLDIFMTDYDIILSPVTAALPPKLGEVSLDRSIEDFTREVMKAAPFAVMFNMSGQPAMSVPLHWSAEGLPVGMQFAGRFGEELTLLRLAAQLEQAAPWKDRRPPA